MEAGEEATNPETNSKYFSLLSKIITDPVSSKTLLSPNLQRSRSTTKTTPQKNTQKNISNDHNIGKDHNVKTDITSSPVIIM